MNWRALFWWRPPCLLRPVIVNPVGDSDTAYQGVLWGSRGAWLTLREVQILRQGSEPARMDGEMVIHRDRVQFLQVMP